MKNLFRGIWDKTKWIIFLTIWTIGVVGWCYFYQEFKIIRCEADWAYNESIQLHNRKVEIKDTKGSPLNPKDDGKEVESNETSMLVQPEATEEVKTTSVSPSGVEKLILEIFGDENYKIARAIAFAESGLNPNATHKNSNGTIDAGTFQINSCHGFSVDELKNPKRNIEIAKQLFDKSGWSPWTTWKSGAYKKYLAMGD